MPITSVSNMMALMEEKFCSLLPTLAINTGDEIAVKMIIGLVDYEVEVMEELIRDTEIVRDRPKNDDGSDIMQAYYLGEKAAHNARIRRYKNRITQLKKIKEEFYEKVT